MTVVVVVVAAVIVFVIVIMGRMYYCYYKVDVAESLSIHTHARDQVVQSFHSSVSCIRPHQAEVLLR